MGAAYRRQSTFSRRNIRALRVWEVSIRQARKCLALIARAGCAWNAMGLAKFSRLTRNY